MWTGRVVGWQHVISSLKKDKIIPPEVEVYCIICVCGRARARMCVHVRVCVFLAACLAHTLLSSGACPFPLLPFRVLLQGSNLLLLKVERNINLQAK